MRRRSAHRALRRRGVVHLAGGARAPRSSPRAGSLHRGEHDPVVRRQRRQHRQQALLDRRRLERGEQHDQRACVPSRDRPRRPAPTSPPRRGRLQRRHRRQVRAAPGPARAGDAGRCTRRSPASRSHAVAGPRRPARRAAARRPSRHPGAACRRPARPRCARCPAPGPLGGRAPAARCARRRLAAGGGPPVDRAHVVADRRTRAG